MFGAHRSCCQCNPSLDPLCRSSVFPPCARQVTRRLLYGSLARETFCLRYARPLTRYDGSVDSLFPSPLPFSFRRKANIRGRYHFDRLELPHGNKMTFSWDRHRAACLTENGNCHISRPRITTGKLPPGDLEWKCQTSRELYVLPKIPVFWVAILGKRTDEGVNKQRHSTSSIPLGMGERAMKETSRQWAEGYSDCEKSKSGGRYFMVMNPQA